MNAFVQPAFAPLARPSPPPSAIVRPRLPSRDDDDDDGPSFNNLCCLYGVGVYQTQYFNGKTQFSGNPVFDSAVSSELTRLSRCFEVYPTFYFLPTEANAMATTKTVMGSGRDGTVFLGLGLVTSMLQKYVGRGWGDVLAIILAHEYAHLVEKKNQWNFARGDQTVKKSELFADFCAGMYMNYRGGDWLAVQTAFHDLGDYNMSNPGHHGTPAERLNALQAGFRFQANSLPSFGSIHSRFLDGFRRHITG